MDWGGDEMEVRLGGWVLGGGRKGGNGKGNEE